METLENVCVLADRCKKAGTPLCNITCYPYVLAHGVGEGGGFIGATGIPAKYKNSYLKNLPIKEANPQAYAVAQAYIKDVVGFVERGVGLFLYSVPNSENKLGTGTGKTKTATAIGNEYLKARIIQHSKGERMIEEQPTVYIRVAELQNTYNKQFRGSQDDTAEASTKFNTLMKRMEKAELLILDDISLRNATESFTNVLYEILDERYINEKPIIFTSNFPIQKIGEVLNPQIQSRIEGMTEQIAFVGKDFRKGGIL
jgi:DNA replication protein DnaC